MELAASAIDFDLSSADAAELEADLASCPACGRSVAALRSDAVALRLPLTLMPSRRVNEAVYREIARGGARPQRFVILVAAALLLLGMLAAAAVGAALLRPQDPLPVTVVTTPRPSSPLAVSSKAPDASPLVNGETWGTLGFPDYSPGVLIEAATFAGRDVVGVGRGGCLPDLNDPTDCYGAAWTAIGGGDLTRTPDQPGLEVGLTVVSSGPPKGLVDVATGPDGMIAIGSPYDGGGPGIWQSPDGRTWVRVEPGIDLADARFAAIGAPSGTAAGRPAGYVIVGSIVDQAGTAARAAAWVSPDGSTWTRAADTGGMDVGPCLDTGEVASCGGMLAVTATGSGYVAVGQARSNAGARSHPAAWTSADGLNWTRSDVGLDFDGLLAGVTLGGPGLIAVGDGFAATSPDGSTWAVSPVDGAAGLNGVVNLGEGVQVFALGAPDALSDPPAKLQLWRTADGVTWQPVPGLPSIPDAVTYGAADIAAAGDRLIIVGWAEVTGPETFRNFAYLSPPPLRLEFTADNGTSVTIAIDDQSGLLVEAMKGEPFSTEDPGAKDLVYEGNYVVFLNDASDDSVLRVEWAAGGGCAANYAMTIDPTARKLRIEGPPAGSDSIGGNCDVSLRFSEPVPADQVEGDLAAPIGSVPHPTEYMPPTPKCPAPQQAVAPPVVTATVGAGPSVSATRGSYTTMTCSTTGVSDAVPGQPDVALLARPEDTLRFTVPAGWRFVRWQGHDTPLGGEGANVWQPVDLPDRPRSIELPVPSRPDDSIVGLTVVLITDDERTVIDLALEVLVRVS